MCLPSAPDVPDPKPPPPAPAPPQPAATVNQASPFNPSNSKDATYNAQSRGVAGLTIPLINKGSLGGVSPVGLGIPVS
jgi:hypothetical protein